MFCSAQQGSSSLCRLGEVSNDSLLPFIRSLEIGCDTKEIQTYLQKKEQLSGTTQLVLDGDAAATDWSALFSAIRLQPQVKEIVFKNDTMEALPYGYEQLSDISKLVFTDNTALDYAQLIQQLSTLPNLQELTIDIVTIFDLPDTLSSLKNIRLIHLINTDEVLSENDTSFSGAVKEPVTYDYYMDKGDKTYAALKYTSMAGAIDSDEYKELAKRFRTTFNLADKSSGAFIPAYKYVKPPIRGLDVERSSYTINPAVENVITYPSGTLIRIPANAFTDTNGKVVTQAVTLSYREFRDPVDFLVSGIPMKYDTAGEVGNFESAGMFELTAGIQEEPLKLAPDKKIDMNFASTSADSTYSFYAFSDSTGNWQYLGRPQPVTPATAIRVPPLPYACMMYTRLLQSPLKEYDSTLLEQRFESKKHTYTSLNDASVSPEFSYTKNGKTRHSAMAKLIRISRVKHNRNGDVLFRIGYLPDAHPELSAFGDVYFASNEDISAAEFRKKYQLKKYYSDIRVYARGSGLELRLKDGHSFKNIAARLVTIDNKGIVKDVKNSNVLMKRYQRRLSSRDRAFDKKVGKGQLSNNTISIRDPEKIKQHAYAKTKEFMTLAEKQMNPAEWESYCDLQQQNQQALIKQATLQQQKEAGSMGATATNLVQSLSLDGLGIYNCDQLQRMKQPVEIYAEYKTQQDALKAKAAYVIDKHSNSVFQYDGYRGFSASHIAFSRSAAAQNTLLAIDENDEIAVYTTEDFKNGSFKNKSHFDFVVTKINSNFTTVSDLKKLIGL